MQNEYFVLMRERSQLHPLLTWDQEYLQFLKPAPVEVLEPVKLKLGEPVPPRPIMVDHHSLPSPVVSPRLKEALEAADLPGVQFVPADVQAGDAVLRYWLVHMWRTIPCMDRQRSVFEETEVGQVLLSLDKLVLDEAVLREVPLHERRAFMLEEDTVHLFHQTVVERVLALTPPPEGLRFIPVAEWGDSSAFR
ncbi:imm11 family protein [Myxococcus sp. Y35]|uniref:imm11 family protein n=1 Tax=Pseudomyxococcus flavus TaxID=3115648 RepID=UPI003CF785D6